MPRSMPTAIAPAPRIESCPADAGLGRSIIPPGTSATRDFSTLAPRDPKVIARSMRRLHGVCERLPRHRDPGHCTAARRAWSSSHQQTFAAASA